MERARAPMEVKVPPRWKRDPKRRPDNLSSESTGSPSSSRRFRRFRPFPNELSPGSFCTSPLRQSRNGAARGGPTRLRSKQDRNCGAPLPSHSLYSCWRLWWRRLSPFTHLYRRSGNCGAQPGSLSARIAGLHPGVRGHRAPRRPRTSRVSPKPTHLAEVRTPLCFRRWPHCEGHGHLLQPQAFAAARSQTAAAPGAGCKALLRR